VIGGQQTSSYACIFPRTIQSQVLIAILFNGIERSGKYVFEDDNLPRAVRARVISFGGAP